jgi:predicted O-methyltransferase YrrM
VVRFWDSAVLPLLEARSPTSIIEIGSRDGGHTRLIAQWAAGHGAILHVIDPQPNFDVDAYMSEWPDHLTIHRDLSLDALARIGPADMILIDGDHNWYTVINELQEIERVNADWPLVLMHDVGWPYGRRDMYYQPETIPPEHRHPYRKGGVRRFHSALIERGSKSPVLKAEREGGPRNGVLTAVEDFLSQSDRELLLFARPGVGGLGVIASAGALRDDATLARVVSEVHDPEYTVTISPVHGTREFGDARARVESGNRAPSWLTRLRRARRRLRRGLRPAAR